MIEDVSRCVTADAKQTGNLLFLLGRTTAALGGSHYLLVEGLDTGTDVPPVDAGESRRIMAAVQKAIEGGLVRACHDLSEGGLAVAAAEMAFSGGLGVQLDLSEVPAGGGVPEAALLFAENAGRFLVEAALDNRQAFLETVKHVPHAEVGRVTGTGRIVIRGPEGRKVIDVSIADAKAAWQGTFDW